MRLILLEKIETFIFANVASLWIDTADATRLARLFIAKAIELVIVCHTTPRKVYGCQIFGV